MTKAIKRYDRMLIEFFIIALLALLLSGIIQSSMSAQSEFRGAISKNAIALTVQDDHAGMSALCNALMSNDGCTAIYKVFPYAGATALWSKEEVTNRPILEGSFFTLEQMQSAEQYAVVGKSVYEKQVTLVNGTPVIYFDTLPYTVVGVLGYENKQSDYDDAFYINLSSLMTSTRNEADGEYIIDYTGKSANRYESIVETLRFSFDEETTIMQVALNKYIPSVTDVLSDDTVIEFLMISMLMVLVSSFSVTLEWIERRKSEIAIRKQLGATTWEIVRYIITRMLLIGVITYVAAYPLYASQHGNIMQWLNYSDCTLNGFVSLAVYGICVLVSLLGCIPAVSAVKKIVPQALAR